MKNILYIRTFRVTGGYFFGIIAQKFTINLVNIIKYTIIAVIVILWFGVLESIISLITVGSSEELLLDIVPVAYYLNAETYKSKIIKDNRGKSGIYRWTNLKTGAAYVGSSTDLARSISQYYSLDFIKKKTQGRSIIYAAILKNKHTNFSLEISEYCEVSGVIAREQYYIDLLKPEYNILKIAGSRLGLKHSEATLAKFRARKHLEDTLIKLREAKKGEKNPMYGKNHSEEIKSKISKAKLGYLHSEESKSKMKGRLHTEEAKDKMSVARGTAVLVTDIETKETTEYVSINKAAKALCVHIETIRRSMVSQKLIKDRYKIIKL